MSVRRQAKKILGDFPPTGEISRLLFQRKHIGYYSMSTLEKHADEFAKIVQAANRLGQHGKKIFLFGAQYYWIEYCTVLGLALAAMGHRITVGYVPYPKVFQRPTRFDIRRYNLYTRNVLNRLRPWLDSVSLLNQGGEDALPKELERSVDVVSAYDTKYLLQVEDVDTQSSLYNIRWERNNLAVRASYSWLKNDRPDLLLVPNSSVLEYGMAYRAARFLNIPAVTFEFSENREEIWLAQNDDIMRQNTDLLWKACGNIPLTEKQRTRIDEMETARMGARTFGKSDRLWQDVPRSGGEQARQALSLDDSPIVMLATNVLGDSLTLGRDLFSTSMADWILRTIRFFADHIQAQLVIRVHPGERFMTGPSMVDIVKKAFPQLPENVRLVGPMDKVNTYDLMELVSLGLVYTTTTGLEMVMNRIPVVVAGETHYRGRGFTLDPASWEEYFALLEKIPGESIPFRLTDEQVELAWRYAYHYFFTYPLPFPWHLVGFSKDIERWPMDRVLGPEGQAEFGQTFRYLAGEPIDWKAVKESRSSMEPL
jgi:hypothetical protein